MYQTEWADTEDATPPALLRLISQVEEKNVHTLIRWNCSGDAGIRITQKELMLSSGDRIVTHVEALYKFGETKEVVLSIKHIHSPCWAKELQVHRSILTACYLTDVDLPVEIPYSSIQLCESASQLLRTHILVEKLIPYLRFPHLENEVSVFWWRAVESGCLVLQNWSTGRLIIFESKGKSLKDAVESLRSFFCLLQTGLPEDFWLVNEEYDKATSAADEEGLQNPHCSYGTEEELAGALENWSLEDGVSPWLTKLVVKVPVKGNVQNHLRYSLGVEIQRTVKEPDGSEIADETCNNVYLLIQVHIHEPLSRELRAYPVCMIPVLVVFAKVVRVPLPNRITARTVAKGFTTKARLQIAAV